MTKTILWGAGTFRTMRPLWVAEELGISYEHKPIEPRTGETQTTEYTALNPKQKVPYMLDGDIRLSESVAISRYLIDRYGDKNGLHISDDIAARAKEDEWVSYVYGELDETSLYVLRRHEDLKDIYGEAQQACQVAREYAMRHFEVIADYLKGKTYLLEDRFSLADIILTTCIDWGIFYGFDLPEELTRYQSQVVQRPAYQKAARSSFPQLFEELTHGAA